MLKCLFFGHKWKHVITYHGYLTEYVLLNKKSIRRKYAEEYYKCERCGMWKRKSFIDDELKETKYYGECPIQRKDAE